MTLDEVAQLAAALPGVRENKRGGRRSWQLRGRMIAREVDPTTLVIRTEFDQRELLLLAGPRTFSVSPQFERHMMVLADLRHGDPDAIAAALTAAHRLRSSY